MPDPDLTQIARAAAEEFVTPIMPTNVSEETAKLLAVWRNRMAEIIVRHLKPVEVELDMLRCDLEQEEASVQWWRDFAARGDNRDDLPHHGGCICKYVYDENKKPKWTIDPKCKYHATAAKYPSNHAIPWNCPTYWDGCNCNQRIRTLEAELTALRAENDRLRKLADPVQHAGNDMEPDEYPGNSPASNGG